MTINGMEELLGMINFYHCFVSRAAAATLQPKGKAKMEECSEDMYFR